MGNILKHLCAKEVQILLTRMEERPEDFVDLNKYTTWRRLMDHKEHYTWIERKLIARTKKKITTEYQRQRLLARILEETVTPTKDEGEEAFYGTSVTKVQMVNDQMRIQQVLMRQMTNAAANNVSLYQQGLQQELQQGLQQGLYANPYR